MRGYTDQGAENTISNESKDQNQKNARSQLKSYVYSHLDKLRKNTPDFLERYALESLKSNTRTEGWSILKKLGMGVGEYSRSVNELVDEWEKDRGLRLIRMSERVAEDEKQIIKDQERIIKEKLMLDRIIGQNGGKLFKFSLLDHLKSLFIPKKAEEMEVFSQTANAYYTRISQEAYRVQKLRND